MPEQEGLSAGGFSAWLRDTRNALIKETGTDVPCGECNACCRSSYFIHIRPGEIRTLSHIPRKLLFPAPSLPKGNVLMGYDEHGRCPMLIDDRCSIYEHRSLTCRAYDCRIFSAAGIDAGDDDKAPINQQVRRWRFDFPAKRDRDEHAAVRAAAAFLREHAECFPAGAAPGNPSQIALAALKVYGVFLKYGEESRKTGGMPPNSEIAKAIMEANAEFETR